MTKQITGETSRTLSVRLSPEEYDLFDAVTELYDVRKSEFARQAIRSYAAELSTHDGLEGEVNKRAEKMRERWRLLFESQVQ